MKYLFCLFLISSLSFAQGKENLSQQIKVNTEFNGSIQSLMISHIQSTNQDPKDHLQLVVALKKINRNLAATPSENINAFLLSEFFKQFFDNKENKIRALVSTSSVLSAQEKLVQFESLYSDFVKYFIGDIIKSYSNFKGQNLLNNYKNKSQKDSLAQDRVERIKLLNKHIGAWITLFLKKESRDFSRLCSYNIIQYFQSVAQLSYMFKLNSKHVQTQREIFLIPTDLEENISSQINKKQAVQSATQIKANSKDDIENLNIDPGTAAQDEIDNLIKKVDRTEQ